MTEPYFKETVTAFRKATVSQEDWDYCATHYMPNNPGRAYRSICIMRLVNSGVTVEEVAKTTSPTPEKKETTNSVVIRSTVLRGIRKMNERIHELPEHKLARLINDEEV